MENTKTSTSFVSTQERAEDLQRIVALEAQVSQLQAGMEEQKQLLKNLASMTDASTTQVLTLIQGLQEAEASSGYSVGGFTFAMKVMPKQDAMIAGVNSVGRPGLAVELNDGDRPYVVARIEWDHQKLAYVLYSGRGVS